MCCVRHRKRRRAHFSGADRIWKELPVWMSQSVWGGMHHQGCHLVVTLWSTFNYSTWALRLWLEELCDQIEHIKISVYEIWGQQSRGNSLCINFGRWVCPCSRTVEIKVSPPIVLLIGVHRAACLGWTRIRCGSALRIPPFTSSTRTACPVTSSWRNTAVKSQIWFWRTDRIHSGDWHRCQPIP